MLCGKNRYFFPPNVLGEQPHQLGDGLEAWMGFFASVRPVYKSLMVNVKVCMSAFYVPRTRVSDALLEFNRQSRGAGHPQYLDGRIRVATTHLGYRKRNTMRGFASTTARSTTFECEQMGGRVSVERYFRESGL